MTDSQSQPGCSPKSATSGSEPSAAAAPSFAGQLSIDAERVARFAILAALQAYAHGTGAFAGQDVIEWYRERLDANTPKSALWTVREQPE